jgi:hypothetical protein
LAEYLDLADYLLIAEAVLGVRLFESRLARTFNHTGGNSYDAPRLAVLYETR